MVLLSLSLTHIPPSLVLFFICLVFSSLWLFSCVCFVLFCLFVSLFHSQTLIYYVRRQSRFVRVTFRPVVQYKKSGGVHK